MSDREELNRRLGATDPVSEALWYTRQIRELDRERDRLCRLRRDAILRAVQTQSRTDVARALKLSKGRITQILGETLDDWSIADVAHELHVTLGEARGMLRGGELPEPDAMKGRSPVWHAHTIRSWIEAKSRSSET